MVVVDYCLRLSYLVVVMIMFRAGIGLPLTCRSAFLDKYLFLMLMGVRMNILRNGQCNDRGTKHIFGTYLFG